MFECTPGSRTIRRYAAAAALIVLGASLTPVYAQVASSLINEGSPLDPVNFPGHNASTINNVAVNAIGGWSSTINSSSISFVWGSVDGVAAPGVIRNEMVIGGITQTSFESRFGMSDTGSVCYSPSITGAPNGGTDAVYVDSTGLAIDGQQITTGPLAGLFWVFGSGPTMSANGIPWFSGGTGLTGTGATTARGLWNGSDTPVLYTGYELPGLPAPVDDGATVDFSYKASRYGTEYILSVQMETTGTGVPSTQDVAMAVTGRGLILGGQLVQEGTLVPVAIGGNGTENWAAFDSFGVSDLGEYLITGDTSAATTADEFVIVNGSIVLREGQVLGANTLTADIEAADMNGTGDWAVIWDVNPGALEALIFNGQVVLVENQDVDFDGDGSVNPGVFLTDFTVFTNALAVADRDAAGNVAIYFPADVNNGGSVTEGVYRLVQPTAAGPAGDLQIVVTDSPDPQPSVPGDIVYSVRVRNNSGAAINSVVVTSTLDPGLTFNPVGSDPIAVHSSGTVTANLGTLDAYKVRTYTFVATAGAAGLYTTTSGVTGATADSVPGNNNASNDTEVGESTDLSVTITDVPDPVVTPGGALTYTLAVFNDGPSNATGVVVTMNLDPTTVFNAGLSDPAAVHNSGVVTINVGNLARDTGAGYAVAVNVTVQGTLTADASVTGGQSDPVPGNNADIEITLFQLTTDLSITLSDDPDPVLPVGGQITYHVIVSNAGPSDATGVTATVTLDDSVSFVSSGAPGVHDGSPAGGVVSFNIGSVPASSNGLDTNIVVDTLEAGRAVCTGAVSGGGSETDPDLGDNDTLINTLVIDDARGLPVGVFSNFAASPTSVVPGVPGALIGDGVDQPYRSPDGKKWIITADTNLATTMDEVIIVGNHCAANTIVQEGVTTLDLGDLVGPIDTEVSINDAGQAGFATDTNAATTQDETIVRWDGATTVVVAREGSVSPATGGNYGGTLAAANIVSDNTVWFDADTTLATTMDRFLLKKNGVLIAAQEGVTVPTNQNGGATNPWQNFGTLFVDAAGNNFVAVGDTDASSTIDGVLTVNNDVKVQEGSPIPGSGFASNASISTSTEARMYPLGNWMARGSNSDGDDWVLHDGTVVIRTGDPIVAGSVEHYDDAAFAAGFFVFTRNNAGDYIVGSLSDANEVHSDALLTLNGQVVIAREHDPIDLDGDGLVDDGIRIRTFGNEDLILTEDLQAYFTCTVRDFNDSGSNTDIGDAFVRLNLCGVATHCGDLDNDKDVDGDDYDLFVLAYAAATCDADFHVCADFDGDGQVTQVDYQEWLLCYRDFIGNPLAPAPATAMGDYDRDADVDLTDFAAYQECAGGSSSSVPCRARFDFNDDEVVTSADTAGFTAVLTGPIAN